MSSCVNHTRAVRWVAARSAVVAVAIGAGLATDPAYAGQDGATVTHGDASIVQNGNHTVITASDGAIINYNNFDILPDETVQFVQPHDLATVLNRVLSNDPTLIQGQLLANGRVFLVNPAGVMFGQNAVINVGSLFAAAGNISDQDFLSGNWRFSNLQGSIYNAGTISGDNVFLAGRHVSNRGVISSDRGIVAMLAGTDVLIREHGQRITVRVDGSELVDATAPAHGQTTPDMTESVGVENAGDIRAQQGQVVLGAGDLYGYALLNSGTIRADGGEVTMAASDGLVNNTGLVTTSVDNGQAGSITVQGPSVVNQGRLLADASSGNAGEIELTSQNHTFIREGAEISAAGGSGNASGGQVIVHSYNGQTIFPETTRVDVSGGDQGGHGGFAEVSGRTLFYNGAADLYAMPGYAYGELLIDPFNIRIESQVTGDPFQDFLLDGDVINFTEGTLNGTTYISAEALQALQGDITLEALGSIFVNAFLDFSENDERVVPQSLTLLAGNMVTIGKIDTQGVSSGGIAGIHDLTIRANHFGANAYSPLGSLGDVQINSALSLTGNLDVDGNLTFINTNSIITAGEQLYRSDVDLCTDAHLIASNMHFMGEVASTYTDHRIAALEITVNGDDARGGNSGQVIFDGNVGMLVDPHSTTGGTRMLESLTVNGNTAANTTIIRTKDHQTYNGLLQLGDDVTFQSLNAGDIRFNGDIDGVGRWIAVDTAGTTGLNVDIGRTDGALAGVATIGGGTTELGGNHDAGIFDYDDAVMLVDDVNMNAASQANFRSTITGQINSLDIASPLTLFEDDVTQMDVLITRDFNSRSGGLTIIGNQFIDDNEQPQRGFNGIIIEGNVINFDQDMTLMDNTHVTGHDSLNFGGTVDGSWNLVANSDEIVRFGGDIGGIDSLTSIEVNSDGIVLFDGAQNVVASEDIRLNPAGRAGVPDAATIIAMSDLTLDTLVGDIAIGSNEKLTVLGDFSAFTPGAFSAADMNAKADIIIGASSITMLGRTPGSLLLSDGQSISDEGVDVIAGGNIEFSVVPLVSGGNGLIHFATGRGTGFSPTLGGFDLRTRADLNDDSFMFGDRVLDLTAIAGSQANLAEALGGARIEIADFTPREPFALRAMDRLAIFMRAMTDAALLTTPEGRLITVDVTPPAASTDGNPPISTNRLRRASVLAVIDRFEQLHGVNLEDDQVSDEQIQAQQEHIRSVLNQAWESYVSSAGENADPAALLKHLEATAGQSAVAAEASAYLSAIKDMYLNLKIMGATEHQAQNAINQLIAPLCPEALTMEQFTSMLS